VPNGTDSSSVNPHGTDAITASPELEHPYLTIARNAPDEKLPNLIASFCKRYNVKYSGGDKRDWLLREIGIVLALETKLPKFDVEPPDPGPELSPEEEEVALADLDRRFEEAQRLPPRDLYEYTEAGVAELIKSLYAANWFYVTSTNDWYRWTGKFWELDTTLQFTELVKQVAIGKLADAAAVGNKTGVSFYAKCCDTTKINHIIASSRSLFAIPPEKVDALTHLFPFSNGVYNLVTHEFSPAHIRDQYLTQISPVDYQAGAVCPMWEEHMQMIFERDQALIDFFQEVAGYAFLHNNPAQAFFVLHGAGQNGKSETSKVIKKIMGSYAKNAQVESIMKRRNPVDGASHRTDLIHIARARMVQVFEGNPEDELAAGLIKQLTGGDPLTARGAYEKRSQEFAPGFKIWFVTNHLPLIDGADYAMMRRVFLIPFHATIPEEKKILDYAEQLYDAESSGILNWILAGLKRYQYRGKFVIPTKVRDAIQKYKTGNDILLEWIEDECVKDPAAEEQKEIVLQNYRNWCDGNGSKALSPKTFWTALKNRGVEVDGIYVNRKRGCKGIRLKTTKELKEFYEQYLGSAADAAE